MPAFTDNRFSALVVRSDPENFPPMTPTALNQDKSKTVHIRHKVVISGTEQTSIVERHTPLQELTLASERLEHAVGLWWMYRSFTTRLG